MKDSWNTLRFFRIERIRNIKISEFMKSIISKIVTMIAILGIGGIFVSCSNDEEMENNRQEYVQIAESRSTTDLLADLYVGSEGDVEAIARILKCTPSSIERIRKGETSASSQFAERVVDVSVYYYVNEQSFSMLRATLDDEWGWYDDVLYFPKHHPFWFWAITIALFLGLAFVHPDIGWVLLIELLLFLLCWIISLICSPDAMQDRYQDSINPTVEQIDF